MKDEEIKKLDLLFKKRGIILDNQELLEEGNKILNLVRIIYS